MPDPTPQECAGQMLQLIGAQRDLFAKILDLSQRQLKLIEAGETDDLLRLLGEKQQLIARNEAINHVLVPLRPVWERQRENAGPRLRQPIEQTLEELQRLLTAVVELENRAQSQAQDAKEQTGQQVGRMQTGKAMLKAYGGATRRAAPPTARYHDNHS